MHWAGVRPLVELPGEGFHDEQGVGALDGGHGLVVEIIHHGFGEDGGLGHLVHFFVHLVYVVAADDAHALQVGDAQLFPQLTPHLLGFHVESGALFRVTAIYVFHNNGSSFSLDRLFDKY